MRMSRTLRTVVALVVLLSSTAFVVRSWRQWFPYRDGIAEHLPESTVAYAHVNLTRGVRRLLMGDAVRWAPTEDSAATIAALLPALRSRAINEIGIAWIAPDGSDPYVAVLLGQPLSRQQDFSDPVLEQPERAYLRIRVVRTAPPWVLRTDSPFDRVTAPLRNDPVQAAVFPNKLPIPAFEPLRGGLPDALALGGRIDRGGIALRTLGARTGGDRSIPAPRRTTGGLLAARVPGQALLDAFSSPFHGELLNELRPAIPRELFAYWGEHDGLLGIRLTPTGAPVHLDALRKAAAIVFPTPTPRMVAGFSATVSDVNPESVRIDRTSENQWTITVDGHSSLTVSESVDTLIIGTSSTSLRLLSDVDGIVFPHRCALFSQYTVDLVLSVGIHPQSNVYVAFDPSDMSVALCVQ